MTFRILIIFLILIPESSYASDVYVYMPTRVKTNVLEMAFKNDCPGVDFTVFDHVRKFEEKISQEHPTGIVTYNANIVRKNDYQVVRIGTKGGELDEPYVLASLNKPIDIDKVDVLSIGAVSFLGRRDMKLFLSELLNANIRLRGVHKREDLLLLLLYGSVDAIFTPEDVYKEIKEISKVNLIAVPANVNVKLVGAAILKNEKGAQVESCIDSLPSQTNSLLGVDSWRKG